MVPPKSMQARACANNCLGMKNQCESQCLNQQAMCQQMSHMSAHLDYMAYDQHRGAGAGVGHHFGNDYGYRCNADACTGSCTQNYLVCHTNCGGQVIEHITCTAFCDAQ